MIRTLLFMLIALGFWSRTTCLRPGLYLTLCLTATACPVLEH